MKELSLIKNYQIELEKVEKLKQELIDSIVEGRTYNEIRDFIKGDDFKNSCPDWDFQRSIELGLEIPSRLVYNKEVSTKYSNYVGMRMWKFEGQGMSLSAFNCRKSYLFTNKADITDYYIFVKNTKFMDKLVLIEGTFELVGKEHTYGDVKTINAYVRRDSNGLVFYKESDDWKISEEIKPPTKRELRKLNLERFLDMVKENSTDGMVYSYMKESVYGCDYGDMPFTEFEEKIRKTF